MRERERGWDVVLHPDWLGVSPAVAPKERDVVLHADWLRVSPAAAPKPLRAFLTEPL